jgi:hypothetical protein
MLCVWPVRVPDSLDIAHFSTSSYRRLLCDQSISLIPQTQHISVCLVTKCYCATSPWPWSLRHNTFQCVFFTECYCVTSPYPWSLRHNTFQYVLLQNAIVTSPCPWSLSHCTFQCLVTECYCVTSSCPWSIIHSTFQYVLLQNAIAWKSMSLIP